MISVSRTKVLIQIVTLVVGGSLIGQTAVAESFDKPIRKSIVELGRLTHFSQNDDRDFNLDCFYYSSFMVKQLWAKDWKGTVMVTAIPTAPGQFPPCGVTRSDPGESGGEDGWVFIGAKGQLLFWMAPDGLNGGEAFRIMELTSGKKIFEDTALFWSNRASQYFDFRSVHDGSIRIRYRRVVVGDCSIPKDGLSCWSELKRHFNLGVAAIPKCTGYRQQGQREWVVGDSGVPTEAIGTESAITYPVEVTLFRRPVTKTIPGPIRCSAAE